MADTWRYVRMDANANTSNLDAWVWERWYAVDANEQSSHFSVFCRRNSRKYHIYRDWECDEIVPDQHDLGAGETTIEHVAGPFDTLDEAKVRLVIIERTMNEPRGYGD